MYLDHFGLREFPFSITPSTNFYFASETSREALLTLLSAVNMGEGFMKITGEVGTGKTMLCRKLLGALDEKYAVCFIYNPYLQPDALFDEIAAELGMTPAEISSYSTHELLGALTRRVVALNEAGKSVVICLDEVQAMPLETLEALRLLTNLETESRKLLQVIIFGQPELDDCLSHPSVRQLRQRITFHYRLKPLSNSEFNYYIQHRLATAGHRGGEVFTPMALWLLRHKSRCIPRLVNILANKALMSAYGRGKRVAGWSEVMRAVDDTESVNEGRNQRVWVWALAATASASVVALAALAGWRHWL